MIPVLPITVLWVKISGRGWLLHLPFLHGIEYYHSTAFSWRAQDDPVHPSGSLAGTDDPLGSVGTADRHLHEAQGRCLKRHCRSVALYHLLSEVTQPRFLHVATVTTRQDLRGRRSRILLGGTSCHWRPGVEPPEFRSRPGVEPPEFRSRLCCFLAGELGQTDLLPPQELAQPRRSVPSVTKRACDPQSSFAIFLMETTLEDISSSVVMCDRPLIRSLIRSFTHSLTHSLCYHLDERPVRRSLICQALCQASAISRRAEVHTRLLSLRSRCSSKNTRIKSFQGAGPAPLLQGARDNKDSAARGARETGSWERWHLRRNLKAHWAPAEPRAEPRGCHTRRKA